jgi:nitrate/nitrite transporter NarK
VPYGMFIAFNYKEYGLTKIDNDLVLTVIGSAGGLLNGVSRAFWGWLMDKYSFNTISAIINFLSLACCASIYWSINNEMSYLVTVVITYACYGGNFSIYPTQTVRILGKELGGKLYYVVFIGFSIGIILS